MTQSVFICFWGAGESPAPVDGGDTLALPDVSDPVAALRQAFAGTDGPVALVDARREAPEGWLPRLLQGLDSDPAADAVTALDPAVPLLTPWHRSDLAPADHAEADRLVRLYAEREFVPQRAISEGLSVWRAAPAGLEVARTLADLVEGSLRVLTCDHVLSAPAGRAARAASGPLDVLRFRLSRALAGKLAGKLADTQAIRSDLDRTVLHVTHSWGGGTQRWISDLAETLDDRRHLILMSRGDSRGTDCGRMLELRVGTVDSPPVRAWPLPSSIRSIEVDSPEHAAIIDEIVRNWGVGQVVVSSLIGHSLAVLRTGLPTAVVCHDYFPAWPNLDVDFEGDDAPFDAERLTGRDRDRRWFRDLGVARWEAVREAYLQALDQDNVSLLAPSESVVRNLTRLAPSFADRGIRVVPHGHRPLPPAPAATEPRRPDRDRWRIVVPGRIAAGKGKALVREIAERFGDRVEFYLLGAGHDGHDFFGRSGFNVVLQYERDELPQLMAAIQPDFALLASTVSETFSYTLSEMWALGIPVIATRRGALADRVENGVNGALFEPTAEAFGELLDQLDRDALERWRSALRDVSLPDLDAMGRAFAELLPTPPSRPMPVRTAEPMQFAVRRLAGEQLSLQDSLERARQRLAAQEVELERRGSWGFKVSRQLAERTQWARELDEHLAKARKRLTVRQKELEERVAWAKALDGELAIAREQIAAKEKELDERTAWARKLDRKLAEQRDVTKKIQRELEERTAWARELDAQLAAANDTVANLGEEITELEALLTGVREELFDARAAAEAMQADLERRLADMTGARDAAQREFEHIYAKHQEVITSRSWQLTKPLRFAARLVRRPIQAILGRGRRTASLAGRTRRSLQVRGVKGTVARIEQEFKRPKPPATELKPVVLDKGEDPIRFPEVEAPRVSIVIPVHNHFDHTRACLRSLLDTNVGVSFEVVVVDDASSDETPERLAEIPGIVHLTNPENLGFVGTCNHGAAKARGDFLVFLNNDTAVSDQWLDHLLGTFESFPDAGLVGAKLVYPDGRLQEAGGIVFSDGSGWNYGRFGNPDDPAYNYVREVDYCSGAAIAIRRDLFDQLGAFDTRYAPAYYEDTDLAFAVRAHGLKVYYQPEAVVTHFEGITSGTDTSSGTKRYQVVNQQKFLDKWQDALAKQMPPGTPIQRARDHGHPRRALVIDACTPEPDKDSGSVRMVHLLALLRDLGYQVSFFADNRAYAGRYTDELRQAGVETWFHPWIDHSDRFFEDAENTFDVAILSRYYVATNYIDVLRRACPRARLLFDTVDLHFLREQRLAELEDDERLAATARRTRDQELGVARRCDVTLVVSPYEREFLAGEAPEIDVAVVSNIHHVHGRRVAWADRRNIMFVGGYQHPPNIDAVTWFARDIFPLVRRELPDVLFHVIGSKATPEVERLGALDGVEFHGFVDEIEPYLDRCRLAVAPLRYGAGVKGKVNSSMSYGQPVVATSPAVEGMFVTPGDDVLVADEPEAFAREVIRAYRDEALWNRLSEGGLDNVRRHFSFEAARASVAAALEERDVGIAATSRGS